MRGAYPDEVPHVRKLEDAAAAVDFGERSEEERADCWTLFRAVAWAEI
jgi:hypothetical protein